MNHLQLILSVLILSSGFGGITVAVLFWLKLRERILVWMIAITVLFTLGIGVNLVVAYFASVLGYASGTEAGAGSALYAAQAVAGNITALLVMLLYAGLGVVALKGRPQSRGVLVLVTGVLVFLHYLVFALLLPTGLLPARVMELFERSRGTGLIPMLSVLIASAYLASCGSELAQSNNSSLSTHSRRLLRLVGVMLLIYAGLAAGLGVVAMFAGRAVDLTGALNLLLYLAWNAVVITGFVRYLMQPADVFAEAGLRQEAIARFGLSAREQEVVRLIGRGHSNKEIAEALGVSFTTARTHVYNIYKKTGAANRVDLLRIVTG